MAATLRAAASPQCALPLPPSPRVPAACARLLRRTAPRRSRGPRAAAASLAPLALSSAPVSLLVSGDLSTTLFALGQQADALVSANLTEVTPATYAVVLVRAPRRPHSQGILAL